jgi:hypothetical protein
MSRESFSGDRLILVVVLQPSQQIEVRIVGMGWIESNSSSKTLNQGAVLLAGHRPIGGGSRVFYPR